MPASGKGGCPSHLGEVAGCQRAAVRKDRRKQSQEAFRCLSFPDRGNGSTLPVAPARSLNLSPAQSPELSQGKKSRASHPLLTTHPLRPHAFRPDSLHIASYRLLASPAPSSDAPSPRPASLPRGTVPAPPHRCCCCCSPKRSGGHWARPSWATAKDCGERSTSNPSPPRH